MKDFSFSSSVRTCMYAHSERVGDKFYARLSACDIVRKLTKKVQICNTGGEKKKKRFALWKINKKKRIKEIHVAILYGNKDASCIRAGWAFQRKGTDAREDAAVLRPPAIQGTRIFFASRTHTFVSLFGMSNN